MTFDDLKNDTRIIGICKLLNVDIEEVARQILESDPVEPDEAEKEIKNILEGARARSLFGAN